MHIIRLEKVSQKKNFLNIVSGVVRNDAEKFKKYQKIKVNRV